MRCSSRPLAWMWLAAGGLLIVLMSLAAVIQLYVPTVYLSSLTGEMINSRHIVGCFAGNTLQGLSHLQGSQVKAGRFSGEEAYLEVDCSHQWWLYASLQAAQPLSPLPCMGFGWHPFVMPVENQTGRVVMSLPIGLARLTGLSTPKMVCFGVRN